MQTTGKPDSSRERGELDVLMRAAELAATAPRQSSGFHTSPERVFENSTDTNAEIGPRRFPTGGKN
eukprot:6492206-Amphidinium_carterae.5